MPHHRRPHPASLPALGVAFVLLAGLSACSPAEMGANAHGESVAAGGGGYDAHAAPPKHARELPVKGTADVARMRAATTVYHDLSRAVEDGFVEASGAMECAAHPELGVMGMHYLHRDRFADTTTDPSRPEILLYLPNRDGRMELVGVEFAVDAEAWHAVHGPDRVPEVAGVPYDPPDPEAHNPLPQTAYTLHIWLWKENPSGIFAPFNPKARCDG